MARHKVFIQPEPQPTRVHRDDVVFFVYRGTRKFGELRVSQGAVVWRGRGDKLGRKLNWDRFDASMQSNATRAERRRPGVRVTVGRKRRRR